MIEIGKEYRIVRRDNYNYTIDKLSKVKSKSTGEVENKWKCMGVYHGRPESAIMYIYENILSERLKEKNFDMPRVVDEMKKIRKEMIDELYSMFEGVEVKNDYN